MKLVLRIDKCLMVSNQISIFQFPISKLSDIIWEAYDQWDLKTKRTIGFQIINSADSISANIAEGFGRFSPADRKNFYLYSRGSFEETKCWLRKLIRRDILSMDQKEKITPIVNELGPKLNSFINSTKSYKKIQE